MFPPVPARLSHETGKFANRGKPGITRRIRALANLRLSISGVPPSPHPGRYPQGAIQPHVARNAAAARPRRAMPYPMFSTRRLHARECLTGRCWIDRGRDGGCMAQQLQHTCHGPLYVGHPESRAPWLPLVLVGRCRAVLGTVTVTLDGPGKPGHDTLAMAWTVASDNAATGQDKKRRLPNQMSWPTLRGPSRVTRAVAAAGPCRQMPGCFGYRDCDSGWPGQAGP